MCELKCEDGYQTSGFSALICGPDHVFRGSGTCEIIDECATNNGGCFEETGDLARLCTNTPDHHECVACKPGFTRGYGFHDDDKCMPRCTAPAGAATSSIAQSNSGGTQQVDCVFPFIMWGRHFVDCADENDGPLPPGLPPGSKWCLTDAHDPTSYKQCVDCSAPGGLECPPLQDPSNGKYICSENAPAYGSSCELKCDAGYSGSGNAGSIAATKRECGWDGAWHQNPFLLSTSMGTETTSDDSVPTCTQRCTDRSAPAEAQDNDALEGVCQFPFEWKGKQYHDCTEDPGPEGTHGASWCATGDDAATQYAKCIPCDEEATEAVVV